MTGTSPSPERHGFLATALYVSIPIAIFAVVTQLLAWTGAISLSTTLLTMWLVALGLIALLSIAYMTCRTYLTAKSANRAEPEAEQAPAAAAEAERRLSEAKAAAEQETKAAQEQIAQAQRDAKEQKALAEQTKAEAGQARAAAAEAERRLSEAKAAAEQETKAAQEQIAQAQRDAKEQKALAEQTKAEAGQARAAAAEAERRLSEAKAAAEQETKAAQEQIAQAQRDAKEQKALAEQAKAEAEQARAEARKTERRVDEALKGSSSPWKDGSAGEDEGAWVPPGELRHLDGSARDVSTTEVFPHGCRLVPDSISPTVDNGQQVYQCRVVDENPALKDRSPVTVVNILSDQKPSPPSEPPYALVEFEHLTLTITPYETDRSPIRMRYTLRATHIKPAVSADATAGSASAEVDTDRLVHDNTSEEGAKAPHQTAAGL